MAVTTCDLGPDPSCGLRTGPWRVGLALEPGTERGDVRLHVVVDGDGLAAVDTGRWPMAGLLRVVVFALDGAVVLAPEAEAVEPQAIALDAARPRAMLRAALAGTARLGLVGIGLSITEAAVVSREAEPGVVARTAAMVAGAVPWRWTDPDTGLLVAELDTAGGAAVVRVETRYRPMDEEGGADAMARLAPSLVAASQHFRALGVAASTPVLQLRGSIPLRAALHVTRGAFGRVHCVPEDHPPRDPATGRVRCVPAAEAVALPGVRAPPLEVWGFVVSTLGELAGAKRGRVVGVVGGRRARR